MCLSAKPHLLAGGLVLAAAFSLRLASAAELHPETLRAWERYVELTEKRIGLELESDEKFLAGEFLPPPDHVDFLRAVLAGGVFIRKMETLDEEGKKIDVPKGIVHHWYGVVFVPGVELADVLKWVQDYSDSHLYYDEVEESRLLSREGDVYRIFLRFKRTKVITVHYATEHEVRYEQWGPGRASSRSHSTRIVEIERAGTPQEAEKPPGRDQGFLWRLNSYWRFKQGDGGVFVDCESMSLSRSIPKGIEWMTRTYVESVPRESLERTLEPIRRELAR
jgi:hypothetical protein